MESLKRKPNLSVKRTMDLDENTKIEVVGLTTRKASEIANNKRLSDFDRGMHLTAAKIRVNGQEITYDDLLDSFTDDEMTKIIEFVNPDNEKNV